MDKAPMVNAEAAFPYHRSLDLSRKMAGPPFLARNSSAERFENQTIVAGSRKQWIKFIFMQRGRDGDSNVDGFADRRFRKAALPPPLQIL
jgi:hypothetical protein